MSAGTVPEALENGHNVAVLGATQTGKTAFARELHATTPRVSIWLNERGKDRVPDVDGVVARTFDEVRDAFASDEYRVEYVPADRNEAIVELQDWLWRVADNADRALPMQVIVDEVDRVAPESQKPYGNFPPRDAVRDFTSEGVKRGVKFVGITQDPSTYDKKALRQSRYRAVWEMSAEQQGAVSGYGFDFGRIRDAPQYAGVLHYHTGEVVGEVKAEERYA